MPLPCEFDGGRVRETEKERRKRGGGRTCMCAREKDIEAKGERGIEGTSDSGAQGVGIARGMRLYHIAPILLSIPSVGRYLLRSLFFLRTVEQKEITRARHPFYSAKVSPGRLLPVSSLSLLHPSFAFSSDSPFSDPHSLRPSLSASPSHPLSRLFLRGHLALSAV